jgi:type IX secretion system PorP/SprF family membrane protein
MRLGLQVLSLDGVQQVIARSTGKIRHTITTGCRLLVLIKPTRLRSGICQSADSALRIRCLFVINHIRMKRFFLLCIILLSLLQAPANGQAQMPYYRQFFFNPYLFNPAFVAINDETEVNLSYRQQWIDFKDAPVTISANAQFPTNSRVALGFAVSSDKQVLLRKSNFIATFGYVVPIAENQSLRFALSGGVGLNKLDLTAEELNTNDPTILNASGNNFYVDGNFGVVYTNAGLRLGFALTDIFESNSFNGESFNEFELSNLKNRIYSVSYKFQLGAFGDFSLEPYFLYRQSKDGLQDAWEAASLLYYKDKFWTGGSYHQHNGLALFLGMNLKETVKFSYSYDFPPFSSGFTSTSSHEIHVGLRLGKKKSNATAKKGTGTRYEPDTSQRNTALEVAEGAAEEQESITEQQQVVTEPVQSITAIPAPAPGATLSAKESNTESIERGDTGKKLSADNTSKETPKNTPIAQVTQPHEEFTMTQGHHYIIVGVFSILDNSMKFTKEMMSKGYVVNVALNPQNNLYYVYLSSSLVKEDAHRMRDEYKKKNMFKQAWVLSME